MLEYSKSQLDKILINNPKCNYLTAEDRQQWDSVPSSVKNRIIQEAVSYLHYQWKPLPATLYLEFIRTGIRINYEDATNERRYALGILTLAECLEYKGRFLDALIDAIWATCEESTWAIPASNFIGDVTYRPLPDVSEDIVELFSSETGVQVAVAYHLLGKQLDAVTPLIRKRMKYEVKKRIIDAYLKRSDFRWMGIDYPAPRLNNWSPWCTSNVLFCTMLIEEDPKIIQDVVWKSFKTIKRFYESSNDDGGCDEGASYWDRAGGSLYDCLELYYRLSGGKIDEFKDPKVQKIGQFIKHMHIAGQWYVNFSDGSASITINSNMTYHIGKRIQDEELCRLAKDTYRDYLKNGLPSIIKSPMRGIPALLEAEKILSEPVSDIHDAEDIYLPISQVMVARSANLVLAAKGGFNEESHNHNDVGQFILFAKGLPVFIDVGVGIYTKQTFGPNRYDIWTMQSKYHNLPTINGVQQHDGKIYAAKNTNCSFAGNAAEFSMDIAPAYPPASQCTHYIRTMYLDKDAETFTLSDRCLFESSKNQLELSFMTNRNCTFSQNQVLMDDIVMDVDSRFSCEIETVQYHDRRLESIWKVPLRRIIFRSDVGNNAAFCFKVYFAR